jgi:2-polyprenyl-3-methyl-5-hydroxy-6-metoxy-1,4-benzoquinol methylase
MQNRYIEISKSRLTQFEDQISWKKINQVIEFGSSYGDTLEDIGIKKKIKNLIGYDLQKPQNSIINFCKEDLNQINLKKYNKQLKNTDLFLCLDTLEHLLNPISFIKNLASFQKKGSHLVVSCPNFKSIRMLIAYIKGQLPKDKYGYFDETHLHWFTEQQLRNILIENGFKIKKIKFIYSKNKIINFAQRFIPSRLTIQFMIIAIKK